MSPCVLRPVTVDDEPVLVALYASTRSQELAQVPWTDEQKAHFVQMQFQAQREHYKSRYPNSLHQIILKSDTPVGRLWTDRQADRIHMLDLTVLPRYRNEGIGTAVIRELQDEAAGGDRALTIYVENYNRSVRLFRRLGFCEMETTGLHILFQWKREGRG